MWNGVSNGDAGLAAIVVVMSGTHLGWRVATQLLAQGVALAHGVLHTALRQSTVWYVFYLSEWKYKYTLRPTLVDDAPTKDPVAFSLALSGNLRAHRTPRPQPGLSCVVDAFPSHLRSFYFSVPFSALFFRPT